MSTVPPYHPDYVEPPAAPLGDALGAGSDAEGYSTTTSDSDEYTYSEYGHRVRKGSEGYEVQPVDREEILRRYITTRGEEAGHYKRYLPEPHSASDEESDHSDNEDEDEDVPLARVMQAPRE